MNWREDMEDVWNQVRHCTCCNEPMLFVDYLKSRATSTTAEVNSAMRYWIGNAHIDGCDIPANPSLFAGIRVCPECNKENALKSLKREESKPHADTQHLKELLYAVRDELGFTKVDTPSTYDGWEVCERISNSKLRNSKDADKYKISYEGVAKELIDYMLSVKTTSGIPIRQNRNPLARKNGKWVVNWSYFVWTINLVFPNEIHQWPIWSTHKYTKESLVKWGAVSEEHTQINETQLFDKMYTDMFDSNPTFDDLRKLATVKYLSSNHGNSGVNREYPWFPAKANLLHGDKQRDKKPLYETTWDFVRAFQKHFCDGGFIFKHEDYMILTRANDSSIKAGMHSSESPIDRRIGRHWFFNYLCDELHLEIDKDKFPYESSMEDLEQVVFLHSHVIDKVTSARKVTQCIEVLDENKKIPVSSNRIGIKRIVEKLWPDYEMNQNLWNRQLVGEKRMNSMLYKVMSHNGIEHVWCHTLHIPTRTGRVAMYRHSRATMKVDGMSRELGFIVEGQGDYHYVAITYNKSGKLHVIPACYNGNAETYLEYRQELDAKKKRAIKRHGFTPIYVVLSQYGTPVKGVHGDIPMWNSKYISDDKEGIGLAETFDMQGREDIGDMIRDYYYDVVLKEE